MVAGRVEDRFFKVRESEPHTRPHTRGCCQCSAPATLVLEAGTFSFDMCPEDAIELALELVREAKAAMQEEKKREMVR